MLVGFFLIISYSLIEQNFNNNSSKTSAFNATYGLGVDVATVDSVVAREFGVIPQGVIINRVHNGSAAFNAGLKRGDIILSFNDTIIKNSHIYNSLSNTIDQSDPLKLIIIRDNHKIDITVNFNNTIPTVITKDASYIHYLFASFILTKVFFILYFFKIDRTLIMTTGAVLMVVVGGYLGFYSQEQAFSAIKLNVLTLLLGLSIVTIVLEKAGLFEYISLRILLLSNKNVYSTFVIFTSATFVLSLFVNNLTTILVFLPVSFLLVKHLPLEPKRFLFCQIAASNLGGATSMIGDFPNMLIATENSLKLHDFFFNMGPITITLFVIMVLYFKSTIVKSTPSKSDINSTIDSALEKLDSAISDPVAVLRGLLVLFAMMICFAFSDTIKIQPSTIAIAGGFFLLLFENDPSGIVNKSHFSDIIFFACLFVLVGGLEASGILHEITYYISYFSNNSLALSLVLIVIISAFFTCFFNAGPSTALFMPIVTSLGLNGSSNIGWWALSTGVCIGSCATLTGATAGPVAATLYEKFMNEDNEGGVKETITLTEYVKIGYPLIGIFTFVSIVYILMMNYLQ